MKRLNRGLIAWMLMFCICMVGGNEEAAAGFNESVATAVSKRKASTKELSETENNDSFVRANPVEVNQRIRGNFDGKEGSVDEDYYLFTLQEAGLIYIKDLQEKTDMENKVSPSPSATVLPDKNEIPSSPASVLPGKNEVSSPASPALPGNEGATASAFVASGSAMEEKTSVTYALYRETESGSPVLLASDASKRFNVQAGTYFVKVTTEKESYRFSLQYEAWTTDYEKESNDTKETATELTMDNLKVGNIETPDDMDYYHLHLTEKCMGRVILTIPYNITKAMFRVTVYRMEENNPVEINNLYSGLASTNIGTTSVYPPGDYYFLVTGNEADSLVDYRIQFSKLDDESGTISNLQVVINDDGNLELNWGKIVTASGYHIYLVSGGAYSNIATVLEMHDTYIYKVKKSGKFQFMVRPFFRLGDNEYETFDSNIVTATIPSKLTKPTFKVKKSGKKKAKVTISSYKKADKILIYMKKGSGKWKKKKTLNGTKTWTVKVGKKGVYCFRIRGYKKYGSKAVYSAYTSAKKLRYKK